MSYSGTDFNGKTVLVTGGAGFIGSNLAFHFQEHYPRCKVIVFDSFRTEETFGNGNLKSFGHFKNLVGFKGLVVSGDLKKKEDLEKLKSYAIDYIFHEAAISDTTVADQKIMIDTNVNAFKDLLDLAVDKNAIMVYASSAATYGSSSTFTVGHERPDNPYGFSKLMMDNLARDYDGKARVVGLRYFNVYGPREYFKHKTSSMVLQFALQLLKGENAKLFVRSDEIRRDFLFVEDVVQANLKACDSAKNGVYNVGTGVARSFQDIVDILKKNLAIDRDDVYIPNPFERQYQYFTQADLGDTRKYLGYSPRFGLEEGIAAYLPEIKRLYDEEVR